MAMKTTIVALILLLLIAIACAGRVTCVTIGGKVSVTSCVIGGSMREVLRHIPAEEVPDDDFDGENSKSRSAGSVER